MEIPEPDPRGYTEIDTPWLVRWAVKLGLYAELAEDLICQPPLCRCGMARQTNIHAGAQRRGGIGTTRTGTSAGDGRADDPGSRHRRLGGELLRQLGYDQDEISYLALQAWTASLTRKEQECRDRAESAMRRGLATGVGWATGEAHLALGLLELRLGNAGAAIEHLEQMDPGPFPPTAVLATPEFIDAALRLGESERPRLALGRFVAGASNKSVAEQPFLSRRTVEYHLAKVFVKLGVSSRLELAQTPLDRCSAATVRKGPVVLPKRIADGQANARSRVRSCTPDAGAAEAVARDPRAHECGRPVVLPHCSEPARFAARHLRLLRR